MTAQARSDAQKPAPARTHLSVHEAADAYGVSLRSLFLLMAQGRLTRHRRHGDRRTFCSVEELERVLKPVPAERRSAPAGPRKPARILPEQRGKV